MATTLMLPLDADSLMTGEAIVSLVRMMQAHPRIGILQSLVVGLPARSAFARIFQFGMRQGMRPYTVGAAWWAGDCGPYWGHNALVRIAPFTAHCELPVLPGKPPLGGAILSHDQVEAVLMRRAGYETRSCLSRPGGYEENPPTLLDFCAREARWCQGNMQYWRLLGLPGLQATSRLQLLWAMWMFAALPATAAAIGLVALKLAVDDDPVPGAWAAALYAGFLLLTIAPKLAGIADVMFTDAAVARYGGLLRFTIGAAIEIAFGFLVCAVTTVATTRCIVRLLLGRGAGWPAQERRAHTLSWSAASRSLWPATAVGLALGLSLGIGSLEVLAWSLPYTLGLVLAVPLAVATASPRVFRALSSLGLCAIPEDRAAPPEIGSEPSRRQRP